MRKLQLAKNVHSQEFVYNQVDARMVRALADFLAHSTTPTKKFGAVNMLWTVSTTYYSGLYLQVCSVLI